MRFDGAGHGSVNLTAYHAKYYAHELTKRCSSDSLEKLAGAVAGAQVDLNPHHGKMNSPMNSPTQYTFVEGEFPAAQEEL